MRDPVLVADLFCGAGGSSSGAARALAARGLRMDRFAVIVGAFGERPGQAPRVHSIHEPSPTICAGGRVQLAEAVVDQRPEEVWIDLLFRMLTPLELAAAMGFPAEYRWAGNKTEVTRQVGNAVPVNLSAALVGALLDAGGPPA